MERHRPGNPQLFEDLQRTFPNLDYRVPGGDGELRSSYFHIALCMVLEVARNGQPKTLEVLLKVASC